MRWILASLMAGGFVLAQAPAANAQDSINTFGGYPAGITSGSPYGFYPGGYRQTYPGHPSASGYYAAPRATYYTSGYYGGTPGATTYSPGVNFSSPNAAAYGYSAPLTSSYGYAPTYRPGTYYTQPGTYRRGLFGRRSYR